jgi:hypothetical protein
MKAWTIVVSVVTSICISSDNGVLVSKIKDIVVSDFRQRRPFSMRLRLKKWSEMMEESTCPTCDHAPENGIFHAQSKRLFLHGGYREPSITRPIEELESSHDSDGPTYQEPTPLLRGHLDTMNPRDAASYAAEAARCLSEFDIDGALACYSEAIKLEPRTGSLLDAYASLLADQGR